MIIKCVAYKNGKSLGDISVDDISEMLKQEDTFVWLGLHEPNDDLLDQIKEEFDLHELAIEDARSAHQRPKLEEYHNSLFVVLQTASLSEQSINFGETHIFVGTRFLVTVRHGMSSGYQNVRDRCESMPEKLEKGPGFGLYAVMDSIVDNYVPVIDGLQERFEKIETTIFEHRPSHQTMEQLYSLKRDSLKLQNGIAPLIDICNELMRFHESIIHPEVNIYFRDISDHLKRNSQAIDSMREMVIAAMQVHLTFETIRQNEVVKGLAGWGAILAIPTMIFSWYGMNFKYMPELEMEYSYPLVLSVIVFGSVLLYIRLKRKGWL
jgi:magnesium transporter